MLAALALAVLQTTPSAATSDRFAPLTVYQGTWSIQPKGAAQPDRVQNHCTDGQGFFTCEQVVNGKPVALIVFTPSEDPGTFHVANVLPNGHSFSDTVVVIRPGHWTYTANDSSGRPYHRTENIFNGQDAIHFEQLVSNDGGQTWTKTGEGEEHRAGR